MSEAAKNLFVTIVLWNKERIKTKASVEDSSRQRGRKQKMKGKSEKQ